MGYHKGKTVRFGISADARLLEKFDGTIVQKNYTNRSEAIRDLIRNQIVESEWATNNDDVVGTVTMVFNHELRELTERLTEFQHQNHTHILSTLHVHLDGHNCLEVLVLKGKSHHVKSISDRLIGSKGVKHGKLIMTTTGKELY